MAAVGQEDPGGLIREEGRTCQKCCEGYSACLPRRACPSSLTWGLRHDTAAGVGRAQSLLHPVFAPSEGAGWLGRSPAVGTASGAARCCALGSGCDSGAVLWWQTRFPPLLKFLGIAVSQIPKAFRIALDDIGGLAGKEAKDYYCLLIQS